jgi:hypothetical protein
MTPFRKQNAGPADEEKPAGTPGPRSAGPLGPEATAVDLSAEAGDAATEAVESVERRADHLVARYRDTSDPADIAAAIAVLDAAGELVSKDLPGRLKLLAAADRAHHARFEVTGRVKDLRRSLEAGEALLALHDRHPGSWDILAARVANRWNHLFEATDEEEALRRSVELITAAMETCPAGHGHHRTIYQRDLCSRLTEIYELVGDRQALDRAIHVGEEAVSDAAPGDNLLRSRKALAGGLITRYRVTGEPTDLDRAIELLEPAPGADTTGAGTDRRPGDLACALSHRWKDRGDELDLDRAIELLEPFVAQVLAKPDGPGPDHDVILSNLGLFLNDRFRVRGDLDDFRRSVEYADWCLGMYAPSHRRRTALSVTVAARLLTAFELDGEEVHALRATALMRQVLEETPPAGPHYSTRRGNLGVLLTRIAHCRTRTGEAREALPLVSEAAVHLRESLGDGEAAGRAHATKGLGDALLELHVTTVAVGDPADPALLAEAVELLEQALVARGVGPDRADVEVALARAILCRTDGDPQHPELARASALATSALQRTPSTSPHRREREELVASVWP